MPEGPAPTIATLFLFVTYVPLFSPCGPAPTLTGRKEPSGRRNPHASTGPEGRLSFDRSRIGSIALICCRNQRRRPVGSAGRDSRSGRAATGRHQAPLSADELQLRHLVGCDGVVPRAGHEGRRPACLRPLNFTPATQQKVWMAPWRKCARPQRLPGLRNLIPPRRRKKRIRNLVLRPVRVRMRQRRLRGRPACLGPSPAGGGW